MAVFGLLLAVSPAQHLLAQAGNATIHGQIADPSGAVIPQASITATSTNGQKYTAISDNGGAYDLRGVAPGTYTIRGRGDRVCKLQFGAHDSGRWTGEARRCCA